VKRGLEKGSLAGKDGRGIPFFRRLHVRLVLFFAALMTAVLALGGLSVQWTVRRSLEDELGRKLEAVAGAAAAVFDPEEIGYLLSSPGPRTLDYFRGKLGHFREMTGAERVVLFDAANRVLLDTRDGFRPGEELFSLRFHRDEVLTLRRRERAHTILFRGIDGRPTMTGFAPLIREGGVIGGVGVDGSAEFFGAADALRKRLLQIVAAGAAATGLLAFFLAKSITRPVEGLVRASERIGEGRYDEAIPPLGGSEIGGLARTMESMRVRVVERERELKAMVAGVAHEIRNPLGGIELFAGLLADETAGNPDAAKHVEKISREVRYLRDIVDRFLEYARPDAPQRASCGILQTVQEAASLLEPEFRKNGIGLSTAGTPEAAAVFADPSHLKRIALNLMRNAVQAMPAGGRLSVDVEPAGGRFRILFSDTGGGIPEPVRPSIFSPFFTTREKGTGLGLSIVRQLAEANGGSVSLVRTGPEGTVFGLELEKG
jgi:signal transduction histidine kinase